MTTTRTRRGEGIDVGKTDEGRRFALPPAIATQATAILGIRGSGKTVTATVGVEELLKRGMPVAIIDPTDVWWGLKSSADGKSEGFPVVVLGGPHGDLPLEEENARALADFAVEERVPLVLSLRHLRKNAQRRFVTDFCEQLYHRKGELAYRTPLLVAIDEASAFVPQKVGAGDARMVGAVEDLVRRGRAAGIGVALVDQRPASLNKDVLTQVEVLVSHQITSPHDRKALDEWVRQHDTAGHRQEFLEGLPSLARGTAWFWSPALDVFELVHVRMRETYDSSKTPTLGEEPAPQANLAWAEVDLDALRAALEPQEPTGGETPEDSGGGPGAERLRRRVADLEAELEAERRRSRGAAEQAESLRRRYAGFEAAVAEARDRISEGAELLADVAGGRPAPSAQAPPGKAPPDPEVSSPAPSAAPDPEPRREPATPRDRPSDALAEADGGARRSGARERVLAALAELEVLGISPVPRATLAAFADLSHTSGTFRKHLADMGREDLLLSEDGRVRLTAAGKEEASRLDGGYSPPRTLAEFHARLLARLPSSAARILRVVVDRHPGGISRPELAEEVGMSHTSGTYRAALALLGRGKLGLVASGGGRVEATEQAFPEGLA